MDLSNNKGLESVDRSTGQYGEEDSDGTKSCADCRTTKTPLWRAGPSGPKSLCNACGIRYRKSRAVVLGLKSEGKKREEMKRSPKIGVSVKLLGLKQRRALIRKLKQGIMGEEEEAAVLLMALSSGLLYASHH